MRGGELTRVVEITPAWDRRSDDPAKDYGVHGCDGSGLRADEWYKNLLLPCGSDAIWGALEKEYREVLCP